MTLIFLLIFGKWIGKKYVIVVDDEGNETEKVRHGWKVKEIENQLATGKCPSDY